MDIFIKYSSRVNIIAKQIIYSFIIFFLFFFCLEIILALSGVKSILLTEDPVIGFSSNDPLFVEERNNDGTIILRTADNKYKPGYFNYQEFPKVKGKNTYRIFCLGGSTTFGHPFTDKASFGRWLHAYLKAAAPEKNWEVINAGGISYASYRVANLMRELVLYQPDLFIVYCGQNEFLEERSYGFLYKLPSWIIDTDVVLSNTRIYSSMKRLFHTLSSDSLTQAKKRFEVSGEVDDILSHTVGPSSYKRDDTLRSNILKHYQINLERMVKIARDVNAAVIFVKPAVNLKDMSPFKSEHKEGLTDDEINTWSIFYEKAKEFHNQNMYPESLVFYDKALGLDDHYAELHFLIGRALFSLGRFEESEKFFWQAVDEDVVPLRMVSPIQNILSMVAKNFHVSLVDFQSILRDEYLKSYGHAVLGNEFFLDHVHTNEHGYRLLGLALFDQLIKEGVLTSNSALSPEMITAVTEQVTASLKEEDYRISFIHLGKLLDWAGKFNEAKSILFKSLESYGTQPEVFELLGNIFSREGNAIESMNYYHKALDAGYESAELYASLGNIYLEPNGDYLSSMKAYQDSLRLNQNDPSVHVRIGYVYVLLNNYELARFHYNKALELNPDYLPAHVNIMALLFTEEMDNEALNKGYSILSEHPDDYRTQYMVGKILLRNGNKEQAIQHFQESLRIYPDFKEAEEDLIQAQTKQ